MPPTEKPRDQFLQLFRLVLPWAIRKLDTEEPFSCLLMVEDGDGRSGTIYALRNTWEAREAAHEDLRSYYQDVRAYAIASPATCHEDPGDVRLGVMVEGESPEHDTPVAIGCLLKQSDDGRLTVDKYVKLPTPKWSLALVATRQ